MTSPGQAAELAGMVLGASPLKVGVAYGVPGARIDGQLLRWSAHAAMVETKADGLLDAFTQLRTPDELAHFAHRFGVLGICEHELPASHNPGPLPAPVTGRVTACYPLGWPDVGEPITAWFDYAEKARQLLRIASYQLDGVRLERSERAESWNVLYRHHVERLGSKRLDAYVDALNRSRGFAITHLAAYLNEWLAFGDARPALIWRGWDDRSEPAFELRASGTFGLMAIQLATAIARAHGVSICDGCAMAYPRVERLPQAGRRNYCPTCKAARIDERDRKRRSRALERRAT